jgi:hypothetical protein
MVPKGIKKPQGRINKVKLLEALLAGHPKKESAIMAGSIAKSRTALHKVVSDAKKDPLFSELLKQGIPDSTLVKRMREGMDATRSIILTKTKTTAKGDKIIENTKLEVPDLGTRLDYIDRIIDLKGLKPKETPQTPLPGSGIFVKIDQIINEYGSAKTGGLSNPYK